MGRKSGSYKFEKRQKELKKQKKKRDKLEPQPSVDLDNLLDTPSGDDLKPDEDV